MPCTPLSLYASLGVGVCVAGEASSAATSGATELVSSMPEYSAKSHGEMSPKEFGEYVPKDYRKAAMKSREPKTGEPMSLE